MTVWCLLGKKAGDNTQVLALAEELGWGFQEKHINARPWELLVHLGAAVTLAGIDRAASSQLQAPWPDLVITAGRRNEPVARWIQQQSGGTARLVHIGRPWAPLSAWDLIVTTGQYFLPMQKNVVHNSLPLHRVQDSELAAGAQNLRPQLTTLPRPWIAVLVGGNSGKFVFTADKGARMGRLVNQLAAQVGGALLVSDSPRTPAAAMDAFEAQLTVPNQCHRCASGDDNPYIGMLALADAFVVTGESMSMLSEAASRDKPMFVFDLSDPDSPWWLSLHNYGFKPLSHRIAMRFGPQRMRRDVSKIQDELVQTGQASWLTSQTIASASDGLSTIDSSSAGVSAVDLERATAAIRQLLS
ncbi:MAG: mitochondrial fission ELM1 family protein [Halioglobus sp.]